MATLSAAFHADDGKPTVRVDRRGWCEFATPDGAIEVTFFAPVAELADLFETAAMCAQSLADEMHDLCATEPCEACRERITRAEAVTA